jgi:hypothetical protein
MGDVVAAARLGSYELVEKIGAGGMGEVWAARHLLLGRLAAVKVIQPAFLQGTPSQAEPLVRRFEREARATCALRSPHAIKLYDYGVTEDGAFYYAMELLEGLDLHTLVERYGPVPVERAAWLLVQACDALAEAHAQGLVHRDVKPANLFACQVGLQHDFVKVLDFGLVKHTALSRDQVSQLTLDGGVLGSPAFLAPEIVHGQGEVGPAADTYALGCVAFWLVTGKLLFEHDSVLKLALAHANEQAPRVSARAPGPVPPELDALVAACLEKDPGNRPASMKEVARALRHVPVGNPWSEDRAEAWWSAVPLPRRGGGLDPARSPPLPSSVRTLASEPPAPRVPVAAPPPGVTQPLAAARRQAVLETLARHFALSHIQVGELERRTELAQGAKSAEELDVLVADLPGLALAPAERPGDLVAPGAPHTLIALCSGVMRAGAWRPARHLQVVCIMGGAKLDLRHAELAEGCTEVTCYCLMGGAEIIVPPDLHVVVDGMAVMGGFEQRPSKLPVPAAGGRWVRVGGFCLMGGVSIRVKER